MRVVNQMKHYTNYSTAVLQSVLGLMKRLRFSGKVFSDNVVNSSGDHLPGSLYYCCLPEIIY